MTRVVQADGQAVALSADEQSWLRVRTYLRDHRYELGITASRELYLDVPRVAGTPLLTAERWMPDEPISLDSIALTLHPEEPPANSAALSSPPFPRYSDGMRKLARPAVFENRPTYRLIRGELHSSSPRMAFCLGRYFDGLDYGESTGHEFAAHLLDPSRAGTQRESIGSPVDPSRRPMNIALSALTIRYDRATNDVRFLLHWRDPALVGHAGGLIQVIPVGIFQPATEHSESIHNDFSLWRCLLREYSEELLGEDEAAPSSGMIDYARWPFAAELDAVRRRGAVRAYCLGMGVDPLTLATDLLCVVVIDAPVFDRIFGKIVPTNAEGKLVHHADHAGAAFTAAEVERLVTREPMQAAGAAVLALAWEHRAHLLA